jgi:hypothetical protein
VQLCAQASLAWAGSLCCARGAIALAKRQDAFSVRTTLTDYVYIPGPRDKRGQ